MAAIGIICLLYFFAGRAGLAVPYTSGNVSPVWPAAGLALWAFLTVGLRVWPGIVAGAFLVNLFTPIPHGAAAGIAIGNTLGPLVAAVLLRNYFHGLSRLRDVALLIAAGLPGAAISATIGTTTLFVFGVQPWRDFGSAWIVWWAGDSLGVLLIVPLLMKLADMRCGGRKSIELGTLIVALFFSSKFLFTGSRITEEAFGFAVLPFIIWGALRFGIGGAALTSCTVSGVAIWASAHSSGPFVRYGRSLYNAGVLQAFIATLSISGLTLATVIAERRSVEQALAREEALRRAEEALRRSEKLAVVGRLAATVSHEVNNPLAAALNLVFLIKGKAIDTETQQYVRMAEQELLRIAAITKRTLGFVREASEPVVTSVPELMDDTIALYEPQLGRNNIRMVRNYEPCAQARLRRGEIQQVFANLITNALDAMRDGGVLTVNISADEREGVAGIQVEIQDTGIGITAEVLPRIFEPFFTTKQNTGTGLGLWLAKEVVNKHEGVIQVESSNTGQPGTQFSVWLPLAQEIAAASGRSA